MYSNYTRRWLSEMDAQNGIHHSGFRGRNHNYRFRSRNRPPRNSQRNVNDKGYDRYHPSQQSQSIPSKNRKQRKKVKYRKVAKPLSIESSQKVMYCPDYVQSICTFVNFFDLYQTICILSKFHKNFINHVISNSTNNKLLENIFNHTFPYLLNKLDMKISYNYNKKNDNSIPDEKQSSSPNTQSTVNTINQTPKEQLCRLFKDWEFVLETIKASKFLSNLINFDQLNDTRDKWFKKGEYRNGPYQYNLGILLVLDDFNFIKYWFNKLLVNVKVGKYDPNYIPRMNLDYTTGGELIHKQFHKHYSHYALLTRVIFDGVLCTEETGMIDITVPISTFCENWFLQLIITTIGRADWDDNQFKKFVDWFFDTITKNKIKDHFSSHDNSKNMNNNNNNNMNGGNSKNHSEKYIFFGYRLREALGKLPSKRLDESNEYFKDLTKVIYILDVLCDNPCCIIDMNIFLKDKGRKHGKPQSDVAIIEFCLGFIYFFLFAHEPGYIDTRSVYYENEINLGTNQWRKCMNLKKHNNPYSTSRNNDDDDDQDGKERPYYYDKYAHQIRQILNLLDKFVQKSLFYGTDLPWNKEAQIEYRNCIAQANNSKKMSQRRSSGLYDCHAIQLALECRSQFYH